MPSFHAKNLDFSIDVPDGWAFLPPAWSPLEQLKQLLEADDWRQLAGKPFCCAMEHHDSRRHAYPTLQAIARPSGSPDEEGAAAFLEQVVAGFRERYLDADVEVAEHGVDVAGRSRFHVRAWHSMVIEPDDEPVEIGIISRHHIVFAHGLGFSITISSGDDPDWFCEDAIDGIVRSIRIRNAPIAFHAAG